MSGSGGVTVGEVEDAGPRIGAGLGVVGEAAVEEGVRRAVVHVPLGVEGAIVGKALYAGAFTLPEALVAVSPRIERSEFRLDGGIPGVMP